MSCTNLRRLGVTVALVALFLVGCGTATPSPTPITVCVRPLVSCSTFFEVTAWIDANANGVRDTGEPPFPGVRFEPAEGQYGSEGVTDENGVARVDFYYGGGGDEVPCDSLNDPSPDDPCVLGWKEISGHLLLEPEIPSGYRLTTPSGLRATDFGFAPLDPAETPVPLAAKLASEPPGVIDARTE